MKNKILILGFDLSYTSPGHAIIQLDKKKNSMKLIECGHIKTNSRQHPSIRLQLIRNYLEGVYLSWRDQLDFVVREAVIFNRFNTKTVEALCHVAGLCVNVCTHHEVHKISPNKAKEHVTGSKKVIKNNEKAEKERVANAVRKHLGLDDDMIPFPFATSDESDACAVVIAFAIQEGLYRREK